MENFFCVPRGFWGHRYSAERQSGAFCLPHNNAAFQKSVFLQQMAHDGVLPVGVDAEIMGKSVTEIQALFQNAFLSAVAGNPVYNAVGEVILPFSFNCPVSGVLPPAGKQIRPQFPRRTLSETGSLVLLYGYSWETPLCKCAFYILCHGKSGGVFHGIKRQVYTAFP